MPIPDSSGTEMNQSAAQNGKISLSPRDVLSTRSVVDGGARLRPQGGSGRSRSSGQGRSAWRPSGRLQLLNTGLAIFRPILFAQPGFRGENTGSSSCDGPPI